MVLWIPFDQKCFVPSLNVNGFIILKINIIRVCSCIFCKQQTILVRKAPLELSVSTSESGIQRYWTSPSLPPKTETDCPSIVHSNRALSWGNTKKSPMTPKLLKLFYLKISTCWILEWQLSLMIKYPTISIEFHDLHQSSNGQFHIIPRVCQNVSNLLYILHKPENHGKHTFNK